ncbi:MAG: hypothetical protein HPAVJP_3610 [Candidatus Hepatoplasma vulgare]|nr:MAG: hypothetical protein HPAVJP_3610 [Candidatus Hepatoplasma sp.]
MILMIIFYISTSEYKYNENGTKSDSYNRNFGLIIFSSFFSFLLINIGGLLISKNNSFIYLMFIFIINCCILFWSLEIMATQKNDGETFLRIGEIEFLLSIIFIIANLIKRFIIFKKQKSN